MTIGLDLQDAAERQVKGTWVNDRSLKRILIQHLYGLANGEIDPVDKTNGLCAELSTVFGKHAMDLVRKHWATWAPDVVSSLGGICPGGEQPFWYPLGREEFFFGGDMWETNRHAQRLQAITHGVVPLGNRTPIYPWERGRIRRTFCAMLAVTMQDEIGELV